jgi:hypothetical protein
MKTAKRYLLPIMLFTTSTLFADIGSLEIKPAPEVNKMVPSSSVINKIKEFDLQPRGEGCNSFGYVCPTDYQCTALFKSTKENLYPASFQDIFKCESQKPMCENGNTRECTPTPNRGENLCKDGTPKWLTDQKFEVGYGTSPRKNRNGKVEFVCQINS